MATIYAFGDSITYGAWDIQQSGWTGLLRRYLDQLQEHNSEYYGVLYNLGIPGETTDGLVKRFESEVMARMGKGEDAVFIFAFGANDVAFLSDENRFKVSKDNFRKNLIGVLDKALAITPKILLVNILPVVEPKNDAPGSGKIRLNKHIEEYNGVLKELAERFRFKLLDVNSAFSRPGFEKLFDKDDGLHPNSEGHKLMFEIIGPAVLEIIGWNDTLNIKVSPSLKN